MFARDYRGVDVLATVRSLPGTPWLLVCDENNINYVTLEQVAGLVGEDEDAGEDDELDFEMM